MGVQAAVPASAATCQPGEALDAQVHGWRKLCGVIAELAQEVRRALRDDARENLAREASARGRALG